MSPLANIEHQSVVNGLVTALTNAVASQAGVRVFPGVNVSDRIADWEKNYRCPDVAVVLPGSRAIAHDAFYYGGPDFVAEIVSDYDRSREKFDFYADVGVREVLIVDRDPWQLELYTLKDGKLERVGLGKPDDGTILVSYVLQLSFCLRRPVTSDRPQIEVVKTDGSGRWIV